LSWKLNLNPASFRLKKLSRGVVITFDDGKSALYSASLLRETFPQAEELKEAGWLTEN
jgi:DUF971 family protein